MREYTHPQGGEPNLPPLPLRPARGENLDPACPRSEQRGRRGRRGRTRGDQIVDHDYRARARTCRESAGKIAASLRRAELGLIEAVEYGFERGSHREPETGADATGEHLGMIEAAFFDPRSPPGHPCDPVPEQSDTHRLIADAGNQRGRGRAPGPQFEIEHEGARRILVHERDENARGPRNDGLLTRSSHLAQTRTAQGGAALSTPAAA